MSDLELILREGRPEPPAPRVEVVEQARRAALAIARASLPRAAIQRPHVVAALVTAVVALSLVPIGGASLAWRAGHALASWVSGQLPPAPAPHQPGGKVWTNDAQVPRPRPGVPPPDSYTPPQPPAAPRPYEPGDQVWKTAPPAGGQATTTDCPGTPPIDDAAKALERLERKGSPITEIDCR